MQHLKNNYFDENILLNKKVLIIGASSGIGRAVAIAASDRNASCIILGRNSKELSETYSQMKPGNHSLFACAFNQEDNFIHILKEINTKYGPLDSIFHSVGREFISPLKLNDRNSIIEIFNSNLFSALDVLKNVSKKGFMNDLGSIIFMSSISSIRPNYGMSLYSAAKAGLDSLVKTAALEFSNRKIRVNSILAGAVDTNMHKRIKNISIENSFIAYQDQHLLGLGSVDDISNLAIFLLSDASRWITGTNIIADGGYSLS
jgi:NAD(P)-dependent dehydrogenase (short-subunit alcohol dehydrogenase family)